MLCWYELKCMFIWCRQCLNENCSAMSGSLVAERGSRRGECQKSSLAVNIMRAWSEGCQTSRSKKNR